MRGQNGDTRLALRRYECGLELTKQAVEDVKIAEQQAELTPEFQALYDKIMRDLKNLS